MEPSRDGTSAAAVGARCAREMGVARLAVLISPELLRELEQLLGVGVHR
jgi:hypothetical protein